jgi:predicted CXXCH cytochrome family protein
MGWNKKGLGTLVGALALVAALIPAVASAQATGIANTKHNLRADGTGVNKFTATGTSDNTEICVFCHTPHGADTAAAVPLWNRVLPAASSFTTYDQLKTSTLDGKVMAVGSVSLACLSCHDGATAMSTVINAPGSGNYNPAGFAMTGTWAGGSQTDGKLTGAANNGISLIGKDLKNDHPIGIQYAGGGISASGTTSTGTKVDPDFKDPQSAVLNNSLVWWVDTATGTPGTRQKTDMILYTRNLDGKDQPFVECASCHDPHSENTTFLRIANTGSAVCLACHTK